MGSRQDIDAASAAAARTAGLTADEAARRLARYGPNESARPRLRGLGAIVAGTLREPMFLLLIAAAALYLVVGDLAEGLLLTAGAGISITLVVIEEARNESALAALRALAAPTARTMRDGRALRLPARDLVPGRHRARRRGRARARRRDPRSRATFFRPMNPFSPANRSR
jgi:Ca2+-transporting ATPase